MTVLIQLVSGIASTFVCVLLVLVVAGCGNGPSAWRGIDSGYDTALVTVVDEAGKVLPVDTRQLFTVAQNDMVVVRGKAKVDESGNFVVVATGVYVRR